MVEKVTSVAPLPDAALLRDERVEVAGLGLKLRLWGDPSLPLVILQHGGKDHGRSWDWTVEALRDIRCIAVPDLRGHGDSDWAPGGSYAFADMVTDFGAHVQHLESLGFTPPFDVIGHSFGGNITLHYTAAFGDKVRSLIAMEGLGFSQESYDKMMAKPTSERLREIVEKRLKAQDRKPRRFDTQDEGIARMTALHQQLHPDQARHLATHALRSFDDGYGWKYDPGLGLTEWRPTPPVEYGRLYADIPCPVLLVYGKESWATSPASDGRMEPFQNVRLFEVEGAGHWPHHDQFGPFIAAVREFLETSP
ncbi:MAG: alpha/beta hydrolase [Pseudomonadota bacterium]